MKHTGAIAVAVIAAGATAMIYRAVSDPRPEDPGSSELRFVPAKSRNRSWVPSEHILTIDDTRGVTKIEAHKQPCVIWLKLPPGDSYRVVRAAGGSAGVRNVAYHEAEDATWSAFDVYREGDFKLSVKDRAGKFLGRFSIRVLNVGRG
jgi:hypothetical protein